MIEQPLEGFPGRIIIKVRRKKKGQILLVGVAFLGGASFLQQEDVGGVKDSHLAAIQKVSQMSKEERKTIGSVIK